MKILKGRGSLDGITLEDFFNRPALIMAVAGILMIIGSIGAWHHWGWSYGTWTGPVVSALGAKAMVGFMGLILIYSSVVNLGYVRFLENMVPLLSVSAICGVLALIGSIGAWSGVAGGGWGLYITVLAAFVSLFAAFRAYEGTSGSGARRSGGRKGI